MNLEEFNIIIFFIGVIMGCITTVTFKRFSAKKATQLVNTHSDLITTKSLQQELDNKQVIIDNFFSDNREQLEIVEKHLETLRNNFADNAKQLSNVSIEKDRTSKTKTTEVIDSVAPPKDYAFKIDKEPGMLSDTFGLDETSHPLEPKRSI